MSPVGHPQDICKCGDYRRDHKGGTGPCTFNVPGKFDLTHGGEDCLKFSMSVPAGIDDQSPLLAAEPKQTE